MLALHGLTGHGQRWQHLAGLLPEIAVAAPDLIGHGRSSWAAPWTIDANVAALAALLDEQADSPVVMVGHSFGGALAMHLAAARPDQVAGLLLLDPAVGLDGDWMREIAEAMLSSPDYPTAKRRARRRRPAPGRMWTPRCSTPSSTNTDRAAGRTVRLADQPAGDDVLLERAWPVTSCCRRRGTPTTLVRAKRTIAAVCQRRTDRRPAANGWARISGCWISTATTWCPTPSPTKSPR